LLFLTGYCVTGGSPIALPVAVLLRCRWQSLEFTPLFLPLPFPLQPLTIRPQAVLPDPLAHVAGALESLGDPIPSRSGALADRHGDCQLPPNALRRPGDGAVAEIEMLPSIGEDGSGLRLREFLVQITTAVGKCDDHTLSNP